MGSNLTYYENQCEIKGRKATRCTSIANGKAGHERRACFRAAIQRNHVYNSPMCVRAAVHLTRDVRDSLWAKSSIVPFHTRTTAPTKTTTITAEATTTTTTKIVVLQSTSKKTEKEKQEKNKNKKKKKKTKTKKTAKVGVLQSTSKTTEKKKKNKEKKKNKKIQTS